MGQYLDIVDAITRPVASARPTNKTKETKKVSLNSFNSYCEPLLRAASNACQISENGITAQDLLAKLSEEEVADLERSPDPLPFLRAFASACICTELRQRGIAPPRWNQPSHCDGCGPVLLWSPVHVAGCPWCWNRIHHRPIPRPTCSSEHKP